MIAPFVLDEVTRLCPKCHDVEDTRLVCRHCGFEYPKEEKGSLLTILIYIIGLVATICAASWWIWKYTI